MWSRRQVLAAGVGLGSLGGALLAGVQAKVRTLRVKVQLQDALQLKHLPVVLAQQLGYFKAEGLEVEWQAQEHHGVLEADVVSSSFEQALKFQGETRSYTAFAALGRAPQVVLAQPARLGRSATAISQLRGRTIGVVGLGSMSQHVAELVLLRFGVHRHEVNFVELPLGAGFLEAFYSGELDAVSLADPWVSMLERWGDVRILSDTRTLREAEQLFGGPVPCACLMATPEFIREQTPACQALSNGVVRALKWLQTAGVADLARVVSDSYMQVDRSIYLDAFNKSRESFAIDGTFPERGPFTMAQALGQLQSNGPVEKGAVNRLWTNRFVEKSKALQRL